LDKLRRNAQITLLAELHFSIATICTVHIDVAVLRLRKRHSDIANGFRGPASHYSPQRLTSSSSAPDDGEQTILKTKVESAATRHSIVAFFASGEKDFLRLYGGGSNGSPGKI
jgi:hypothetical protein